MYRRSAVQCEQLFSFAGYIVDKAHSSLEANRPSLLLICSCAWVLGYPSTFGWENACAIHCFSWI